MSLATIALVLAAPIFIPTQLTPGPLIGPNGGALEIHDVELSGSAHWVLATEADGMGGHPVVATIDGAGTVAWMSPLPSVLTPVSQSYVSLLAVGENRILVREPSSLSSSLPRYLTYTLTPLGWVEEMELSPPHLGTYRHVTGDISGTTVLFSEPLLGPMPTVVDYSMGTLVQEIPVAPSTGVSAIAIDGGTVVAYEGRFLSTGALEPRDIVVYRRVNGVWTRAGEIDCPTGFDWRGFVSIALEGSTVAVAAQKVSPTDPCPKLYIFEEDPSGAFVLSAEFEAASPCATSSIVGVGYEDLKLLGSELVAVEGLDGRADRFERTATGWVRRERVAAESKLIRAWPIDGQVVGLSSSSLSSQSEAFAPVDSAGSTTIACSTTAPVLSTLLVMGRNQTTVGPIGVAWHVHGAPVGTPYLFVVGLQSGSRVFGPTAELCIGGPLVVIPAVAQWNSQADGNDWVPLQLDPVAAGLQPGGTLYVQVWRPDSVFPGGLTSNSLAIIFAP